MNQISQSSFKKIAVLMGGTSSERDISLLSGAGVLQALQKQGINAHAFDMRDNRLAQLVEQQFDAAFIALHGRHGEDGTVQGALELLGIPYTGSGVMASSIAMDKIVTKRLWQQAGLPVPRDVVCTLQTDLAQTAQTLGLPLIMKPPHEGSTIGISKVEEAKKMQAAFDLAINLEKKQGAVLAEEFIQGRELTVALLEQQGEVKAMPIVEIIAPQGNYDYENKYFRDDTRYICPAQLDEKLTKSIQAIAVESFKTLGCSGWARADVMLRSSDNQPFLLEINTAPGMTTHSLVPMAARAEGLSYEQLCLTILQGASLKS